MSVTISLKEMFKNGVHYGHKASRWNPKMKKYIYEKRSGIHLIDLEKSADKFAEALEFLHQELSQGKTMMFVATKLQTADLVAEYARATKTPYVIHRWLGGTLTNFKTIQSRIRFYKELEKRVDDPSLMERYTKKEQAEFRKELERLQQTLGGMKEVVAVPDILFVTDVNHDRIAITEAQKMGIPVVGFVDTNANPNLVDYPIPANDDAINSLKYLLGLVNEIILDARNIATQAKVKQQNAETKQEISDDVIAEKEEGAKKKSEIKSKKPNTPTKSKKAE